MSEQEQITMCENKKCKHRKTCYRFNAEPNLIAQQYYAEDVLNKDGSCDYYWEQCPTCHLVGGIHKMSCPTKKLVINLTHE